MNTVTVRPITAESETARFRIFAEVRAEELGLSDWSAEEREPLLRMQFNAQRSGFQAAYPDADESLILLDGRPVGVLVVDRNGPSIHLVDIAIAIEAQGLGIGTQIVVGLQDEAHARARPLTLSVLRTNVRAMALYAHLGFQVVGQTDTHHLMEWRRE
jgi:ribosomal protein S18 acetylase RimI-like enzyme